MEKSKGHWTFHLSNGSNGPPIFHWTFACPLDPMDKWNVQPMQDVRWKNQKAIGHSICQMDQMDLQFSIGLLLVHWIQWTNGMSIGQQWINRNYASTE